MRTNACWCAFLAMCLACSTNAATIYVDDDAPNDPGPGDPLVSDGAEDGSAAHPFDAIQEAIDVATNGDEIVLADGTYRGLGNRDLLINGVAITMRSASGDPNLCVIDCEQAGRGMLIYPALAGECRFRGITIANGYVDHSSPDPPHGGGVHLSYGAAASFEDCRIVNCIASLQWGGGVFCRDDCRLEMVNCTIKWCVSKTGGGLLARYSDVTLIDCELFENVARRGVRPSAAIGGASLGHSPALLLQCRFLGNGAVEAWEPVSAGAAIDGTNFELRECSFVGNSASGSSRILNCGFVARVDGCTFVDNVVVDGAVIRLANDMQLRNTIVRDSVGTHVTGTIYADTISHCNIAGGVTGVGNIDADPLFVRNPDDGGDGWIDDPNTPIDESANNDYGDLRLQAGSPCIDAGDPLDPLPPAGIDLDGNARLWDGDGDGTTRVDMGAYEYAAPAYCAGDSDCDGDVDFDDIGFFVTAIGDDGTAWRERWGGQAPACAFVNNDLDLNGAVDFDDITPFVQAIGSTCD